MTDPLPLSDRIRPYASRIAKVIVTAGATWLLVHYKIDMPAGLRAIFEELIGAGLAAATLGLATHFAIATKLNPDDAATPHSAAIGKAKQRARKQTRKIEDRLHEHGLAMKDPLVPTPEDSDELPPR